MFLNVFNTKNLNTSASFLNNIYVPFFPWSYMYLIHALNFPTSPKKKSFSILPILLKNLELLISCSFTPANLASSMNISVASIAFRHLVGYNHFCVSFSFLSINSNIKFISAIPYLFFVYALPLSFSPVSYSFITPFLKICFNKFLAYCFGYFFPLYPAISTISLKLMCMYSIPSKTVTSRSYNPSSLLACIFVYIIFNTAVLASVLHPLVFFPNISIYRLRNIHLFIM